MKSCRASVCQDPRDLNLLHEFPLVQGRSFLILWFKDNTSIHLSDRLGRLCDNSRYKGPDTWYQWHPYSGGCPEHPRVKGVENPLSSRGVRKSP
ncbi:hypothetical protein J6590_056168 [Homalodisca vitripennis]|nr:hypothetical protein J6590_056168 [Homalodisca vitripennis]